MDAPRKTYAERQAMAREKAQGKARRSVRLGTLGIVVLFASGLGLWLLPDGAIAFLAGMVLGILVILYAFLLVRESVQTLEPEDRTKIL